LWNGGPERLSELRWLPDAGFEFRNEAESIAVCFLGDGRNNFVQFPGWNGVDLESVVSAAGAETKRGAYFVGVRSVIIGTVQFSHGNRFCSCFRFFPAARCYRQAEDQDAEYEPKVLHRTNVKLLN